MILGRETLVPSPDFDVEGWAVEDQGRALSRVTILSQDVERAVQFYSKHFNMKMRVPLDLPEAPRAALYASDKSQFCLEIVEPTDDGVFQGPGEGFLYFTLIVPSSKAIVEGLERDGHEALIVDPQAAVVAVRSLSDEGGQTRLDTTAIVRDLDGYTWRLVEMRSIDRQPVEALATIALRVKSVKRSLEWWTRQGATIQQEYEATQADGNGHLPFVSALCGWGRELMAPQLEFRETKQGGKGQETDSTGIVRIVIETSDLRKTTENLLDGGEEHAEDIQITSVKSAQDTESALRVHAIDGWEVCFVQVC